VDRGRRRERREHAPDPEGPPKEALTMPFQTIAEVIGVKTQPKLSKWWETFFRPDLFLPGEEEHMEQAPSEVRFIQKELSLKKDSEVLDLCCGVGRHSILLADKGVRVTGIDAMPSYLRMARERADRAGVEVRWVQSDMRKLTYRNEFDAVLSCWTSFGYFPSYSDDVKVLKQVARSLRKGGSFFLDTVNGEWLRTHAKDKDWRRQRDGYILEEIEVRDGKDPATITHWTFIQPGRPIREGISFVRLYDKARAVATLKKAGLTGVRFFGGYHGEPLTPDSKRLIVVAKQK
jgi:2-polyprenyl-3-methyl-5-hydroxy-6-metoxy-1,4-benzoquinol methylase